MSYTGTKYLGVRPYPFPRGSDNTQRMAYIRGNLVDCDTATEYCPGGIGSSSFEVTAFSAVGLVTYSNLKGDPLVNGQRVVVYNTASNTNDGTYIVSVITPSSASAGTFVAIAIPGKALSGSAQTTQTAEGVGQLNFGNRNLQAQTFTATAVTWSGGVMTVTHTTLTGHATLAGRQRNDRRDDQLRKQRHLLAHSGLSNFLYSRVIYGHQSQRRHNRFGNRNGKVSAGSENASVTNEVPVQVNIFSAQGYIYRWDPVNYTIRIFLAGAGSGTIVSTSSAPTITTSSGGVTTALGVAAGALSEVTGATGITGVQAPTITSTFTGTGGGAGFPKQGSARLCFSIQRLRSRLSSRAQSQTNFKDGE